MQDAPRGWIERQFSGSPLVKERRTKRIDNAELCER